MEKQLSAAEERLNDVCTVVNHLIHTYDEDIYNLDNALFTGSGNCFASMRLGGAALKAFEIDGFWYQAIYGDAKKLYHGSLASANPGSIGLLSSDLDAIVHTITSEELDNNSQEGWRELLVSGHPQVRINGSVTYRTKPVSKIAYSDRVISVVRYAALELGIAVPGT